MHQLVEDPLEVGKGIFPVNADLLDEGVDYGTAPAGFFTSDEHPVLVAELERANRVLGVVVIKLDLAVHEARLEMRPLAGGIDQRFAEQTAGRDAATPIQVGDEFSEMFVMPASFQPAGFLPFERAGAGVAQPCFDLIDFSDLIEDPSDDPRVIVAGSMEVPADVDEAGDGDDVQLGVARDEGLIGAQAVALKMAVEGRLSVVADEDVVEAGVGATFVKVEKHAVFGMVVGPEVSEDGFADTGLKAAHGSFVDFDVGGGAEACGDQVVERKQTVGEVVVPGAHEVARELDAVGGLEFPLLTVKGAVVAEFLGEQVGT